MKLSIVAKRINSYGFLLIASLVLVFSMAPLYAEDKSGDSAVGQPVVTTAAAQQAGQEHVQPGIMQETRSQAVENARSKRRFFLRTGGLPGFVVWVLLVVNFLLVIFFLTEVMVYVHRNRAFPRELVKRVQQVLHDGELGFAMEACVPYKTPLARILFEGFKNIGDGFDACQDAMVIAVSAEKEKLMKPVRSLIACAIFALTLGWLGWAIGLTCALRAYAADAGPGSLHSFAYTASQAFYPLIVSGVLACAAFYVANYAVGKVNRIIVNTEKIATDLMKVLRGANIEGSVPDISTMTQLLNYNSITNIPPKTRI